MEEAANGGALRQQSGRERNDKKRAQSDCDSSISGVVHVGSPRVRRERNRRSHHRYLPRAAR
jgi:hypothetical protein